MRRIPVASERDYPAVGVETELQIGDPARRDARPGEILLQHPLYAHGCFQQLRQDRRVGFRAIPAERRPSVLAGLIQPPHDDLLNWRAERVGDLDA